MRIKIRVPREMALLGHEALAAWLNAAELIGSGLPILDEGGAIRAVSIPALAVDAWDGISVTPEQAGTALRLGMEMVHDGSGWTPVNTLTMGLAVRAHVLSLRKADVLIRRAVQTNSSGIPYIRAPHDATIPITIKGVRAWWIKRGDEEPYITLAENPVAALLSEMRLSLEVEFNQTLWRRF